mmetsp:Transcript_15624/g.31134  ORF Transcript_15624/g.31134 Transcript_15624/m.31134 type:complete len:354 (+) Transcript_15624:81-1142(+)
MMFQRKSPSIFFLLACSLILSQVTHVVVGAKTKKSVSPSVMVSSDAKSLSPSVMAEPKPSHPPISTIEPKKAKTGESAEAKLQKSSGAPTFTISPTSTSKAKVVSKSKKSGAPTVTISPTSNNKVKGFSKSKEAKTGKSAEAKSQKSSGAPTFTISPTSTSKAKVVSKSKKSGAPTMTIAPTSVNKAKTVSKSKKAGKSVTKAKASKSTTSFAPSVTNSPTSTNISSKQNGSAIKPSDRTVEKTRTSDIPNAEEINIQNNGTTLDKEGRATDTRISETSVNGEAAETTNGSDQNKNEEEEVIFAKTGGNTDKSTGTFTSSTTIFGLVVMGVVFCGVGVGVYMKMRTPSPIDEN